MVWAAKVQVPLAFTAADQSVVAMVDPKRP
jgi:hypothetical protein